MRRAISPGSPLIAASQLFQAGLDEFLRQCYPRIVGVNADHGRTSPVNVREFLTKKEEEGSVTGTLKG